MTPKKGKPYRLPTRQTKSADQSESDAQLFGHSWTDSAICLPWADYYGARRYAVLSPSYGGDVLICRFRPGPNHTCQWWYEPLQTGISGVTHWRLADDREPDYWLDPRRWPEQGAMGICLKAQRRHWLYCDGPCKLL